jgi:hypothetical protein
MIIMEKKEKKKEEELTFLNSHIRKIGVYGKLQMD